ncbi:MAG: LPS assembly lipoprotein LptE [Thermodesulfobacteriota bacterium]
MTTTTPLPSSRRAILPALLLALAMALSACGYSNPYVQSEDAEGFTPGAIPIFVDMWENKTSELGFQSEIKQSLVSWLKKSPHFSMARTPEQADYILSGVIESIHLPGLSYGKFDRAIELRAEVIFSVELKKRETGQIILKRKEATWHESFRTGGDAAALEMNKRKALQEVADNIAENIYVNLFNRFSAKKGAKADIPVENTIEDR